MTMGFLINTPILLSLVTAILIPGVASLLSRAHWPSEVTALLTITLAAASGFFAEWANNPHAYDWKKGLLAALGAYIIAVGARVQLWQHTKTDGKLLAFPRKSTTV